ncbi:hypothetical protein K2173_007612 [Erythroxylum novogranatense]|uniref:Exopolygalacturonase-like n=1 Tax=Erythroxylum novogranatense TaxID=1862640 RepID=A0AAV8S924_9ROSI|nr:hypothetical protein K2173_007612 [Erythroxylum novogranatense]
MRRSNNFNNRTKEMAISVSAVTLLLMVLAYTANSQPATFDITKYGAVADEKTDSVQALTSAWNEACASPTPSSILVPPGNFLLGKTALKGPCKAHLDFQLQGTFKAPADPSSLGDGWITMDYVDSFSMSGGGIFDGQGETAWGQNNCHKDPKCKALAVNLRFNFFKNTMITKVTSLNSKNFHINLIGCGNFTFKEFNITAPAESLNTDGIHIGKSNGINIIDTHIGTGDDCISLGDGCQNINITGVTCGPGHGISIGSLGKYPGEEPVTGVFVKNCTFTNTDNGVRIKSWPALSAGTVADVHYEDIIVNNVSNPVVIDQMYCPWNQCNDKEPSKVKISNVSIKNVKGTSFTPTAVKLLCSSSIPCEGVEMSDIDITYAGAEGPAKSECTNVKPTITGTLNPPGC